MNKKSQIQINETTLVVMIVVIVLILGLSFYAKIQAKTIESQKNENQELRAIDIAQTVINFPELQCSPGQVEKMDCFDIHKVIAVNQSYPFYMDYFYQFFGSSRITVSEVFPGSASYVVYENVPAGAASRDSFYTFISLYNSTSRRNQYSLAALEVEIYSR